MRSYSSLLKELHVNLKKLQKLLDGGEKAIVDASNKAGNPLCMLDIAKLRCAIGVNISRFSRKQQATLDSTALHLDQALICAETVRFKARFR